LDDAPPVALAGPVSGQWRILLHGFALFRNAQTRFAAGFGLAVEGLRHRCRAADVAHAQHIDLKAAGIVFDLQAVAGRTSRAGLARKPFDSIRPRSQAREAMARVLKKRAAQSHLSIRTVSIPQSGGAKPVGRRQSYQDLRSGFQRDARRELPVYRPVKSTRKSKNFTICRN